MADWKKWSRIQKWAKLVRQAKKSGQHRISDRAIAAYVTAETGKNSERSLINAWMNEEREPYLSQFFALCQYLKVDPAEVLGLKEQTTERSDARADLPASRSVRFRTDKGVRLGEGDLASRSGSIVQLRGAAEHGSGAKRSRSKSKPRKHSS